MRTNLIRIMLGVLCFMFYSCHAQVGKKSSPIGDTHTYVNLGLPSGTLWATCNIGANSPEEYGDYFAWGETEGYNSGKTNFSWDTYKWCKDFGNFTKYCTENDYGIVDNKTELDLEDDAAYVNWGPDWHMPSIEQLKELIDNDYTNSEWTSLNGVNGYKITSKINANSIFLPAAGCRSDSSLYCAGSFGDYWSRTLYASNLFNARYLYFRSSDSRCIYTDDDNRCSGQSVRPVRLSE